MSTSDQILLGNAIATFFAVMLAPLVALWIGGILQKRSELAKQKLTILGVLISFRHDPLAPEAIRSLNLIDAVFADDRKIREAWTKYFAVLNDGVLNNPVGYSLREEKRRELLLAMVEAVNLSDKISSADLLRTYTPQTIGYQNLINYWDQQLRLEQLEKVLAERGIPFTPMSVFNQSTPPQPPQPERPANTTPQNPI